MKYELQSNILLVDDNSERLRILEDCIAELGENVIKAFSSKEALNLVLEQNFAVILIDLKMFGGLETAELIRLQEQYQNTIPIILLASDQVPKELKPKIYSMRQVDYLRKPINKEELKSRVATLVYLSKKIEELKLQNSQIKAKNKQLKERANQIVFENERYKIINQGLANFSYCVSHDLRNPITCLKGYIQMLLTHPNSKFSEVEKKYLHHIQNAGEKMNKIIEDLLRFSLGTHLDLKSEIVDLSSLICEIVSELYQLDSHRSIEFVISEGISAKGDSGLLKIALENLLNNAWKYTKNCRHARIEFGVLDKELGNLNNQVISNYHLCNERVYFVRDNGVGFDMKDGEKLFKPFSRLHDAKEFGGTGIGLATVRNIICRHGGHIWAKSKVNKGTTFYFTLPESNRCHSTFNNLVVPGLMYQDALAQI